MTNPAKAIIFDFGNVLSIWDPHHLYKDLLPNDQAVDAFLKEINFSAWNVEQDKGRSFADGVAILSAQFPHYSHLIQAYDERGEDSIAGAIEGTIALVYKLKRAKYPLYLLSNFSCEKFSLMRQRHDYLELFDDIIISGEHNLVKPDPAIYHLTLKRIERAAQECIFIDDSLPNIETANELGFQTIRFVSPAQLETALHTMDIL
ncbi:MAG: HAD family phosphatase [Anaerolineales bacterium]|nr:HAD family phosphatase [Anaerolineales bacterium]